MDSFDTDRIKAGPSYQDLINQCKMFRKSEFRRFSLFSFDRLNRLIQKSLSYLKTAPVQTDPTQITKTCCVIDCLRKMTDGERATLIHEVERLKPDRSESVQILTSYVLAKLCKGIDSAYAMTRLRSVNERIKEAGSATPAAAHFLVFLSRYCGKQVIACSGLFLNATLGSLCLNNGGVVYEALSNFVRGLAKAPKLSAKQVIDSICNCAHLCIVSQVEKIVSVNEARGGMLMYLAVLESGYGSQIRDRMTVFKVASLCVNSDNLELRHAAIGLLILLGKIDEECFMATYFKAVATKLTNECSGKSVSEMAALNYLRLVSTYDEFFENQKERHLQALNRMIINSLPQAYELLDVLVKRAPQLISGNPGRVKSIITAAQMTEHFATYMPGFFEKFPEFWNGLKKNITATVCNRLASNPNVVDLKFVQLCKPLESPNLVTTLFKLFSSDSIAIRTNLALAILNQTKGYPANSGKDACNVLQQLLRCCLGEISGEVRYSVIHAMLVVEEFHRFLTPSELLESLHVLINDEYPDVRIETVRLLSKVHQFTSFLVLPILRHVILDNLALFDSERPLPVRAEHTHMLEVVIPAAFDLMAIYLPVFHPSVFDFFQAALPSEMTVFERNAYIKSSISIIHIITMIAERDISLLSDTVEDFLDLFISLLSRHNCKELKMAALEAMTTLVAKSSNTDIDRQALFSKLSGIAGKWNSRKLNLAFLQFLGLIGAVELTEANLTPEFAQSFGEIDVNHNVYYLKIVCETMIAVLNDESSSSSHLSVCQFLVDIFCQGIPTAFDSFKVFMPILLKFVRSNPKSYMKLLKNVCKCVPVKWISPFCESMIDIVHYLWHTPALLYVLDLIPALRSVMVDRMVLFLPQCILLLLECLADHRANSKQESVELCRRALVGILALKGLAGNFAYLVVPEITSTVTYPRTCPETKSNCLITLRVLVQYCDCRSFSPNIVRCILSSIRSPEMKVQKDAMQVLYSLQVRLGSGFAVFDNEVKSGLRAEQINMTEFSMISNTPPPLKLSQFKFIVTSDPSREAPERLRETIGRNTMFTVPMCFEYKLAESPWDRKEWFKTIRHVVIRDSPCQYISDCKNIAYELPFVAERLFNIGFLSCWEVMEESARVSVRLSLQSAMCSEFLPDSARSALVSLIEFMNKAETPINIDAKMLCDCCSNSGQNEKSFGFSIMWLYEIIARIKRRAQLQSLSHPVTPDAGPNGPFRDWITPEDEPSQYSEATDDCIDPDREQLLECQQTLIHLASTLGMKMYVQGLTTVFSHGQPMRPEWFEELGDWENAYNSYSTPVDKVRCLEKMMKWDDIIACQNHEEIARYVIIALHHKEQYADVLPLLKFCDEDDVNSRIFGAIAELQTGQIESARNQVKAAFDTLARRAKTIFMHDKSMLYSTLVSAMQLTELSEVIDNNVSDEIWETRLNLCRKDFNIYRQIIEARYPFLDATSRQKYATLLLKMALEKQNWKLFDSALHEYFPSVPYPNEVQLLQAQSYYEQGKVQLAIDTIFLIDTESVRTRMASRIHLLRGQWLGAMNPSDGLPHVTIATRLEPESYRAWHRLAWLSAAIFESDRENGRQAALDSVHGFLESVKLGKESAFSDLIEMITIIKDAKLTDDDFSEISEKMDALGDSFLLRVVPQLLVQLVSGDERSTKFIRHQITKMLPRHFHVLLFSLLTLNHEIVREIVSSFESQFPRQVNEARVIRESLLKLSTSDMEQWVDTMIDVRKQIKHNDTNKAATLLRNQLKRSQNEPWTTENKTKLESLLELTPISIPLLERNVDELIKSLESDIRSMQFVPTDSLASVKNSLLSVPGVYEVGKPLVTIERFSSKFEVMHSKQRPRLVKVYGNDGKIYKSILKANEDLRLGQRVMQFFNLINMHIRNTLPKEFRNMRIHCYSIMPLSFSCGLIQFIEGTDTIFDLISDYRKRRGVDVHLERRKLSAVMDCSEDSLRPIQRLEFLNEIVETTSDADLAKSLHLKSSSLRHWINRTERFTESSSIMSIVGYILGISDRHPSNIMIDRQLGEVIHIDFADLFEMGRMHTRLPEMVPFRLTRMIRRAFGPSDYCGPFLTVSEKMMNLVRTHKESIMAVLDIFITSPVEGTYGKVKRRRSVPGVSTESMSQETNSQEFVHVNVKSAIARILEKVDGKEDGTILDINSQVMKLIDEATNMYNLAHAYHGWAPLW